MITLLHRGKERIHVDVENDAVHVVMLPLACDFCVRNAFVKGWIFWAAFVVIGDPETFQPQ